MTRLASPASGCKLRLVEVEVGSAKEIYDSENFDEPIELSLEGQRSSGSDFGILSLVIAAGARQMLSMRLNDLLNHPNGAEGTVSIDKDKYKLCVRLPNRDHTLTVWFSERRDFLVSVCILRKSGFTVEDSTLLQNRDKTTTKTQSLCKSSESRIDRAPRLSSITSLSMLATQAKAFCTESLSSNPQEKLVGKPSQTVFDEVLERLHKASAEGRAQEHAGEDLLSAQIEPGDLSYLNPYNVFSTKKMVNFNQPKVSSPLKNVSYQEQLAHREIEYLSTATSAASSRGSEHKHRYLLRSFSSSNPEARRNAMRKTSSSSLHLHRNSSMVGNEPDIQFVAPRLSNKFGSDSFTDFRQLMPQRRKLPFTEYSENVAKRSKTTGEATETNQRSLLPAACDRTQTYVPETTIMLMHNASLDKLDEVCRTIFDQYEEDISSGYGTESVAGFYLERLHVARTKFWLKELAEVSESEYLKTVGVYFTASIE